MANRTRTTAGDAGTGPGNSRAAPKMMGNTDRAQSDKRNLSTVRERMEVIASCGTKIGVVDHVEGNAIKLTRNDSPDGQRHYLPASMIERVDDQVHLNKNSEEARKAWKPDAASGGCG